MDGISTPTPLGVQAFPNKGIYATSHNITLPVALSSSDVNDPPWRFSSGIEQSYLSHHLRNSNQDLDLVNCHDGAATTNVHLVYHTVALGASEDLLPSPCGYDLSKNGSEETACNSEPKSGKIPCPERPDLTSSTVKQKKRPKKPSLNSMLPAMLSQQQHMDSSEKQHQCPDCPKKYSWHFQLQQHARTHTGERPFVCDKCHQAYKRRDHLIRHERIHTGERPFVCDECGKKYRRKPQLARHKLVHTGERPHCCKICSKAYRRRGHLIRHMKMHQSKEDSSQEGDSMPSSCVVDEACYKPVELDTVLTQP